MRPKPDACRDCPIYGDGRGFVPDEIVDEAEVMVLGQNPGADEEREGRPFVGKTGQAMEAMYFPVAGLERGRVSIGNALRCRWQRSNALPPERLLKPALAHCTEAHFTLPSRCRLIVAQGALAWRALGGPGSITAWRGFLKPTLVLLTLLLITPAGAFAPLTPHRIAVTLPASPGATGEGSFQSVPVPATGALVGWSGKVLHGTPAGAVDAVYSLIVIYTPSVGVIRVYEPYEKFESLPDVREAAGRGYTVTPSAPATVDLYCLGPVGGACAFDLTLIVE